MIKIADYDEFLTAVKTYIEIDFKYCGTGSLPGTPESIEWLEKTFANCSTPMPCFRKTRPYNTQETAVFIPRQAMTAALCSVNPITSRLDYIYLTKEKKDCDLVAGSGLKFQSCRKGIQAQCRFPFFRFRAWKVMIELPDMNYTHRVDWDFFVDDEFLSIICQLAIAAIEQKNYRIVPVLMSYIRRLPALGDAERIPGYLEPLRNFRRLDQKTLYYIYYKKTKPRFGAITLCESQDLLKRASSSETRRARYDDDMRSFLEKNPPETVREIAEKSGIVFPEDPFNSDGHYLSYFNRVKKALLNEFRDKEPDDDSDDAASQEGDSGEQDEQENPDTADAALAGPESAEPPF